MRLKNIMILVENIEVSVRFYKELFGLQVMRDFGCNVMLTEGLVLQERTSFEELVKKEICYGNGDAVLYFVEQDLAGFAKKLKESAFEISYVQEGILEEGDRRVLRLYDPDGHMIEVGEYRN